MKLAMVITSLEVGGAEKLVLELIQELKDKIEIRLYIIKKNYDTIYDQKLLELNIEHFYLNAKSRIFSFKAANRLKKLLNDFQPEIIHTHLKAADYICYYRLKNNNFRWVHTVHTLADADTKKLRRLIYRPLYKKGVILPVAVSKEVEASIIRLYGINGNVIPNGVNLEKFKYIPDDKQEFVILHVGRFIPLKNHKYLINEYAKFSKGKKNTRLILIGSGPLKKKIKKLVRKLEISKSVKFIDSTPKIERFMQEASVFVLPSKYEGMSLALLEALATGLLVITRRGLSKLIEHEVNGFEIDLEENALFYELENLYENYSNLEIVRRNATRSVNEYSLKAVADNYLKLYGRIIND